MRVIVAVMNNAYAVVKIKPEKRKKKGKERAGEKIEVISRYKETPLSKAFSHWIEYSSYFFQK